MNEPIDRDENRFGDNVEVAAFVLPRAKATQRVLLAWLQMMTEIEDAESKPGALHIWSGKHTLKVGLTGSEEDPLVALLATPELCFTLPVEEAFNLGAAFQAAAQAAALIQDWSEAIEMNKAIQAEGGE